MNPLPDSHLYKAFRNDQRVGSLSLREPADFHEPIPVSEKLVQAIWSDQLFDTIQLVTRDGRTVQVLHPGRWNVEGGPDFLGAHLRIGGVSLRGDIEIHLHATGWNDHHHASNPAYNKVILDVCLWDSGPLVGLYTQSGHLVPQLSLQSYLQCSLEELTESLDPDRYPFSLNRLTAKPSPLLRLSPDEISQHVNSAGVFRFEQKTARITEIIQREGAVEAAYQLLAEALGYKHNKICFRETSRVLPLAGLLALKSVESKIKALLAEAERHSLRLHQVRPSNHPHRRLAALALIVHSHPNLTTWFHTFLTDAKAILRVPSLEDSFWSWHYHREGNTLPKKVSLLGPSRWKEIVTNVLLPFCYAEARTSGNSETCKRAFQIYCELPASQSNRPSRQIAYELGLATPKKAIFQQGLIQMYQDFELLFPDPMGASHLTCKMMEPAGFSPCIS